VAHLARQRQSTPSNGSILPACSRSTKGLGSTIMASALLSLQGLPGLPAMRTRDQQPLQLACDCECRTCRKPQARFWTASRYHADRDLTSA